MLVLRYVTVILLTGLAGGVLVWSAGELQETLAGGAGAAGTKHWIVLGASLLVTIVLVKYVLSALVNAVRQSLARIVSRVLPFLLACLLGALFLFA